MVNLPSNILAIKTTVIVLVSKYISFTFQLPFYCLVSMLVKNCHSYSKLDKRKLSRDHVWEHEAQ